MVVIVIVIVVLVSLYPLSLAGHLSQRRTFIYYCTSIRLCIGGQAALASAGISHKTTRVLKTCPPCMFDELEDYENRVIDLG